MSKFQDGIRYYVLVAGLGLLVASITVAFYLLYLVVWGFTQTALDYSILIFVPLAFLAIGLPYALVRLFASTKTTGSGTHTVLEAYHLTNGDVPLKDTVVKPTAAMLTIGLGGSAGPEGPSLLAGGGIAAALSRRFRIQADLRRRLFIAGAAAGLAATFQTPLTGILFALEIPYKNDLDRETFIEAVVASVPAYLLSITVLGSEPFFGAIANTSVSVYEIGLSMVLGLICGLYAVFFTKTFSWVQLLSFKLRKRVGNLGLVLLGGAILSLSGILSVYSIGIGLHFVSALIQESSFSLAVLILVVLLKTFTTATTLSFGGSGGLFFPTIVVGAGIGYIFASFFSVNFAIMFTAVGMAALLAGTHKVLLTPVAFVVETLGGVFAIPALLASGVSYVLSGKHSFYPLQPRTRLKTEELALERFFLKGQELIPEKLKETKAKQFMTKKPVTLHHGTSVKVAVQTFEGTKLRVLPVVDDDNSVMGVVNLEDLGYVDMRRQNMTLSETIMHKPVMISEETSLEQVAQQMMDTQQDHVFISNTHGKLTGVISGIDVVKRILELISE
ncbi:MAG: chloride channel protein [Candidatus Bathyarchaeota archaeon]|nr:chloride channel protein [Candidatus Bathyarchaeota archaeon]